MALKTKGTYKGKSNKLGGGGRFAQVSDAIQKQGYDKKTADAVAAAQGMKKYGTQKMGKWSAAGRKRVK